MRMRGSRLRAAAGGSASIVRPMWSIRLLGAAFCVWALSMGCGEDGDDGSGISNTGGSGGSGATVLPPGIRVVASVAAMPRVGECMSSADCSGGGGMGCAQVPSGYRVCTFQTAQATTPSSLPALDECDASDPCPAGACFYVPVFPAGICGVAAPQSYNVCRNNGCTTDAECGTGVCGPAGFSADEKYGGGLIRQCLPAACRSDGDCSKLMGGRCSVVQAGCDLPAANGVQAYIPAQMACVYPNGCSNLSDCANTPGAVCKVISGEGVCVAAL